jgi:hypothetical protein
MGEVSCYYIIPSERVKRGSIKTGYGILRRVMASGAHEEHYWFIAKPFVFITNVDASVVFYMQFTVFSLQYTVYSVQFTHIAASISGKFHSYCNNIACVRQARLIKRPFYRYGLCGGEQQWDRFRFRFRFIRPIQSCPLNIIVPNLHNHSTILSSCNCGSNWHRLVHLPRRKSSLDLLHSRFNFEPLFDSGDAGWIVCSNPYSFNLLRAYTFIIF